MGLYSPHKAVCVNAIKFAAIIHATTYSSVFQHWSDVLIGGLGSSVQCALAHFVGANFSQYQEEFLQYIGNARASLSGIAEMFPDAIT